jgi:hypothetical protein
VRHFARIAFLVAVLAALAACSTSRETWIGRNVGVTVDSAGMPSAPPPDAR